MEMGHPYPGDDDPFQKAALKFAMAQTNVRRITDGDHGCGNDLAAAIAARHEAIKELMELEHVQKG
jgi:hypothetical protein